MNIQSEVSYGCHLLRQFALIFAGRVDTKDAGISFCCENLSDIPRIPLCNTGKESIENFITMRKKILASPQVALYKGCAKCSDWRQEKWQNESLIHYVNLSMYPSPCDCLCIYCGNYINDAEAFSRAEVTEGYEKAFDSLDYAKNEGLIASSVSWQVSVGEITIHPYKDRILDLVKNQSACFFTNCFRFDEKLGKNLAANPRSGINLSIDSGTPETWRKVKGVDNFKEITDNLASYYKNSSCDGQINLKYIVLPGINDSLEDYSCVIELMKNCGVKALAVSRDVRYKYNKSKEETGKLICSTGTLVAMLIKNGLKYNIMSHFSPSECVNIETFAEKLLRSNGDDWLLPVLVTEENFNAQAYLDYNEDVAIAFGRDEAAALQHFRNFGKQEERLQFNYSKRGIRNRVLYVDGL